MNPFKLLKKLAKLLRGGAGTWEIFAGCLLGMIIGMTPGFNMTVVIAVVLLLVLNAHMALALTALAIGKILCLALAPVTFEIGYVLVHGIGLEGLFHTLSQTPVLALMNLHYYCLVGGLPIALVLGCAMGWSVARVVRLARAAIVAGGERSERFRKLSGNVVVRIILRLAFGKQKKSIAEALEAKRPLFRKAGVVICAILLAGVLVFEYVYADRLAGAGLKAGVESAVGVEVNVGSVSLSLLGGRIKVTGLQVTDPDKPTHNLVQIDVLEGNVSVSSLLARRLVLEKIHIGRIGRDVKRATPGEVFEKTERPPPKVPEVTISDYFEDAEKVPEYLRKLKDYLDEREEGRQETRQPVSKADVKEQARLRGYLKLSADTVLAKRPVVTIRRLEIDQVQVGDAGTFSLVGEEISEAPELNGRPMKLTVTDKKGFLGEVVLNFTGEKPRHSIRLKAPDVPLGGAIRVSKRVPLDVSNARADIEAAGEFTSETIDLSIVIQLRDMKANARGGRGFLGLDPATASTVFKQISNMRIVCGLRGPLAGPQPWVDEKALMSGLKETLAEAGKSALSDMVGKQADKLVGKGILPSVKGPLGDLLKGTGGLLKGGGSKDSKPGETTTKPASLRDRLPSGLLP
jgi:uncharacterized protein (TIGR03546 family)